MTNFLFFTKGRRREDSTVKRIQSCIPAVLVLFALSCGLIEVTHKSIGEAPRYVDTASKTPVSRNASLDAVTQKDTLTYAEYITPYRAIDDREDAGEITNMQAEKERTELNEKLHGKQLIDVYAAIRNVVPRSVGGCTVVLGVDGPDIQGVNCELAASDDYCLSLQPGQKVVASGIIEKRWTVITWLNPADIVLR